MPAMVARASITIMVEQQADVAVADIAALAGARIEVKPPHLASLGKAR